MDDKLKGRYKSLTQIERVNSDASPADVQKALKGVEYPASRQDLLDHAKNNSESNEGVLEILEKIPNQNYESPVDVSKAVGDLE